MNMKDAVKFGVTLAIVCGVTTGCGGAADKQAQQARQAEQEHVQAGVAAADADDPSRWAPSPRAIESAKKEAAQPMVQMADNGGADIALGAMEKLPPQPEPPRLSNGDEADQYVVPAWEQIARGDLRVKRIHY